MANRISVLVALEGADEGLKRAINNAERSLGGSAPVVRVLGVPATYLAHGKPDAILADLGLDAAGVAAEVRRSLAALG